VNDPQRTRNPWMLAAATLVALALIALAEVLLGRESSNDYQIFLTLGPAVLAGAGFYASIALLARGGTLVGALGILATPIGFALLAYSIWHQRGLSDSGSAFWAGIVVLPAALMVVAAWLLAKRRAGRWLAGAATLVTLVAGLVSLDAGTSNTQFWRVGERITSLWILASVLCVLVPVAERAFMRPRIWLSVGAGLAAVGVGGIVWVSDGRFDPTVSGSSSR